ncbi:putative DNA binding domain-containing protein [bacterium]|nr:putative DNA binding domain-containing protein [bacterium]
MKREELEEFIRNGEGSGVEFKLDEVRPEAIAKTVVAMANRQGGFIFLGVDDRGEIKGLTKKEPEEWVMEICRRLVSPSLIPAYYEIPVKGLKVGVIKVPLGIDKPYCVQKKDRKTYYVRAGSTNREATREELRRLYQASGVLHYDTCGILTSFPDDLDYSRLHRYFLESRGTELAGLDKEETLRILVNTGILSEEEENRVCTVGGILLFGREPARILPSAGAIFAAFDGTRITDNILDRKQAEQTLPENVENISRMVRTNLPVPAKIEGLHRKNLYLIPEEVVREAVVNAFIHRDYTISGAKVMIFLFSDRLEVKSPGRPPNTMTVEKMKAMISMPRNPMLLQFMYDYHYIERLGRGIPMIFEEMRKLNVEPEIRIEEEETILSLPLVKRDE